MLEEHYDLLGMRDQDCRLRRLQSQEKDIVEENGLS